MSYREFLRWQLYAELEPFGPPRDDLRAGVVASAAVSPWVKKGDKVTPATFFPELAGKRGRGQTPEEQALAAQGWAMAMRAWGKPANG